MPWLSQLAAKRVKAKGSRALFFANGFQKVFLRFLSDFGVEGGIFWPNSKLLHPENHWGNIKQFACFCADLGDTESGGLLTPFHHEDADPSGVLPPCIATQIDIHDFEIKPEIQRPMKKI